MYTKTTTISSSKISFDGEQSRYLVSARYEALLHPERSRRASKIVLDRVFD